MNKFFKSRMIKSMIPYFIFAIGLMLMFVLITNFNIFTDAFGRFWSIISPFLTGAVIAYILNLPCTGLQRLIRKLNNQYVMKQHPAIRATAQFIVRKSRAFSVLLLVLIIILLIILAANILVPAVQNSLELFWEGLPNYETTIREWLNTLDRLNLPDFLEEHINADTIVSTIMDFIGRINVAEIMSVIISGFGGFASTIFQTFLAIVSSIYLLIEKDKFKAFVIKFVAGVTSDTTNETILKYSRKLDFNFRQYIFAQTIDGIILGSIMTVVLLLFGSPFALILGLILGIVNYIPYFGSIFGTAFAVLVIAFTQGIPTAALAAVIMFAIQQLDGNYIQPKLMGKTFSLSPLLVIISVTIGMHYGGIFGMLVAIPIVAILKDVVDLYIAYREEIKARPQSENNSDFMDKDIWL